MKQFLRFLMLFVGIGISISQTNAQDQPEHEKKNFQDKDGTVYWNKHLPFYISISTSENGEGAIRLNKDKNKDDGGVMYFDTEGINWIRTRWDVDLETGKTILPKEEVIWPVQADGLPPETSAIFTATGKFITGGKTYYSGDLSITLNSKDHVSGIEKIYYSDGGVYQTYSGAIQAATEGAWKVKFYAVDRVGNIESSDKKSNMYAFEVDMTPPVTRIETTDPKLENILSPKSLLKLISQDAGAGVYRSFYAIDQTSEAVYPGALALKTMNDGMHKIKYYSVDRVKNKEEAQFYEFYLDKIPPKVEFTVEGDQFRKGDGTLYVSDRSNLKLIGTDNKAGVADIFYTIDNKELAAYTAVIPANQTPGEHYISYFAGDRVENRSITDGNKYAVDIKAPIIKYKMDGPNFERRDTLFVRDISKFIITPYEAGAYQSGVKDIYYVDNDQKPVKCNGSFSLTEEGLHRLKIIANDNVNNSAELSKVVYVDNTPPEIFHHYSVDKIGSKQLRGEELEIFPSEVQVYLAATDAQVGAETVYYTINHIPERLYKAPIKYLKTNTNFTFKVRAVDLLGNESKTEISFSVEE